MGLNFISTTYLFIIAKTSLFIVLVPLTMSAQLTSLPDIFARVMIDDSYINIYYFFWTNFWYLPLFFGSILLMKFLSSNVSFITTSLVVILASILSAILVEIVDYSYSNTLLHYWEVDVSNFNILLINSINKYHPFLLYYGLIKLVVLTLGFIHLLSHKNFLFTTSSYMLGVLVINYRNLTLLTTTLYLGAWWAVQEGSWGGWWNWDPSEVFGLVAMGFFVRSLHLNLRPASIESVIVYKKILYQVYSITVCFHTD